MTPLFAFLSPGVIIVLLLIGVLLFGRRLPEIGRILGKGIVEFKKGIHGLEDELDITGTKSSPRAPEVANEQIRAPQRVAATAPKFEDAAANTNISAPPRV